MKKRKLSKLDFLEQEIRKLKESGLYNPIKCLHSAQGAWIIVDGAEVLNLCSNNYLGLANDQRLKEKVKKALDEFGIGAGGARTICGTMSLHRELEQKIAHFKRREGALVFGSGVHANVGIIPSIAQDGDVIFTDELNHGSIIDGCRLSKAKSEIYPHKDLTELRNALKRHKNARRRLIVTDGVFSMDGDIAPLTEIVELSEKYDAIVMVDDAHGEGVLGDHGRGITDHFGLHERVDIEMGTFSKAFGVVGGFICGSAALVEYLSQTARTFLLATASTAIDIAACIAAVEILEQSDDSLRRLWENTRYFKDGMRHLGFDVGASETPIIPVLLGDTKMAQEFEKRLIREKVLTRAITYPTVPRDRARLRLIISAAHRRKDLEFALRKFGKIGHETHLLR
jgi:glycine C-acetyltransferase